LLVLRDLVPPNKEAVSQLRELSLAAANYLTNINTALSMTAFFLVESYGHQTSIILEAMNKVLKQERELPILNLLDEIWLYIMD